MPQQKASKASSFSFQQTVKELITQSVSFHLCQTDAFCPVISLEKEANSFLTRGLSSELFLGWVRRLPGVMWFLCDCYLESCNGIVPEWSVSGSWETWQSHRTAFICVHSQHSLGNWKGRRVQTTVCPCMCVEETTKVGVRELQHSRWKVRATVASGGAL